MIEFISHNFMLFISFMYIVMTFTIYTKLKNADKDNLRKCGKTLMEMPLLSRQKLLFRGKSVKIFSVLLVLVFATVTFCRILKFTNIFAAVGISMAFGILLSFLFFEFTLLLSSILKKLISVKSIALNSLFSSAFVFLAMMYANLMLDGQINSLAAFAFAEFVLALCYIMLVITLVFVMKEANNEQSGLTLHNIWKSAFLTIILFIFCLSLMSFYCVAYDASSISGVTLGFFDIVYYTVITFATVGFGDIFPVSAFAKGVSMLTVLTSVLCITVLLSEIIGIKKQRKNKND